ncbi:EAL domain-containing protein [Vibrio renipiscarius]|uniref:Histidine kinase n=1 Tax=Vibrio renipiscarius TaxID=1461322 RepID=A0A0C2NXA6_9VIBR|nr:EAL domain-containing protein [Vibrio renipiscarius]KII75389.1 histidine kinase [Vibrio renipiscarius]KII78842.1 histidine kinase [Vibrio renipiscarius]
MEMHLRNLLATPSDIQSDVNVYSLISKQYLEASIPLSGSELDVIMNDHFKYIFDVFNGGLFYMTGPEQTFLYNPAFYQQFGLETGLLPISRWIDCIHPLDRQNFKNQIQRHFNGDDCKKSIQYRVRKTDGQYIWVEGEGIAKNINGQRFAIGCHTDISDTKLMEIYLQQAAFRDRDSGLSNAHKLSVDLDSLNLNGDKHYSLVCIHLEDSHAYLSSHGPELLGDLMGHLLASLDGLSDTFVDYYRIRTDDFAILVEGHYDNHGIEQLGERILKTYSSSIEASGYLWGNDISIGILPNFDVHLPSEEIIKIASQTSEFSRAKRQGNVAIYHHATKVNVDRHFYIERQLSYAITNNTLSVCFQPIINAKQGVIASFEALVRWNDSEIGVIYPDEFISVAEKKGLIVQLGYLVFKKACQFIKRYQATHQSMVKVNINVSVLQLLNNQFPDQVKQIADSYGIQTQQIVLELTETFILDGEKNAASQLHRLNELGFKLSLDDFGAGYSSLNSFFDLPLKQIKIDKSMAWRALDNTSIFEYLRFITQLCHTNGVDVVIEGIENANMQRTFTDMGADYLQGFWFAKPLCLASASELTMI